MPKLSAGLLLYRYQDNHLQVLLVHPAGPFWRGKDEGAWSIPKGEYEAGEDAFAAALREFEEETGAPIAAAPDAFIALTPVRQPSGKVITAWAVQADFDPSTLRSNTFELEWPPHSGSTREFAEVDRAEWFDLQTASTKIQPGQLPLLRELAHLTANLPTF